MGIFRELDLHPRDTFAVRNEQRKMDTHAARKWSFRPFPDSLQLTRQGNQDPAIRPGRKRQSLISRSLIAIRYVTHSSA
jgi:hypothetical protein